MGMVLPYWTPEQILREEEPYEKEDAPRQLVAVAGDVSDYWLSSMQHDVNTAQG